MKIVEIPAKNSPAVCANKYLLQVAGLLLLGSFLQEPLKSLQVINWAERATSIVTEQAFKQSCRVKLFLGALKRKSKRAIWQMFEEGVGKERKWPCHSCECA